MKAATYSIGQENNQSPFRKLDSIAFTYFHFQIEFLLTKPKNSAFVPLEDRF